MTTRSTEVDHWSPAGLSAAARSVWGKSDRDSGDAMLLTRHISDTAEVAGLLWDRWLPQSVRAVIRGSLSDSEARQLFIWLAASHDLGKCSPAFAMQVESLASRMCDQGLSMTLGRTKQSRSPHSHVSFVILRSWLIDHLRFDEGGATSYAVVVGGHHGVAPLVQDIADASLSRNVGGGLWVETQRELAAWAAHHAGVDEVLPRLTRHRLPATAQVLMTAAVIVADWIASSVDHFPYNDQRTSGQRAAAAWVVLGLTPPWAATSPPPVDVQFRERFALPAQAAIRPIQLVLAQIAHEMAEPGLIVVEAPMGEGKTEAALMAVETLAARFGAGGCFVALPTMATSDALFSRLNTWLSRLPVGTVSAYLAHGKAALNDEYQELMRLGRVCGVHQDDEGGLHPAQEGTAVALAWLSGRKKGVLSSFVVGTIDQVLMGGLKSRHLMLRHLALAGKVVVIDEVHASDEYMAVYLDAILTWLGAYRVPTILLSATLPASRRSSMVQSYLAGWEGLKPPQMPVAAVTASPFQGRVRSRPGPTTGTARGAIASEDLVVKFGYPLVTTATTAGVTMVPVPASGRRLSVAVELLPDDDATLVALLTKALAEGGCVGVVRNTVDRAQDTARALRAAFGDDDVTLIHSRFLGPDRMRKEVTLRRWLGPPGPNTCRPSKLIVVGTQVLEQSLDIDFDLLVTDLAPMDLLLQRMGRLHRHDRDPRTRAAMSEPRCVIVGVEDWAAAPPVAVAGSLAVYGMSLLLRSAATLSSQLAGAVVAIPADVPRLVEYASAPELVVHPSWTSVFVESEAAARIARAARVDSAATYALGRIPTNLIDWTKAGVGDAESADGQAKVRDGDDSIEVLVAQRIDGVPRIVHWIGPNASRELPTTGEPPVALAKSLATCTLRLPARMCRSWRFDRVVKALELDGVAAWQSSRWLQGQLVLFLDAQMNAELDGEGLTYSPDDGLMMIGRSTA